MKQLVEEEYRAKRENARLLRRRRANIPEMLEMETFPFARQPKLDRKKIMSYYDGFDYMTKQRNMVWLGPTGCGKTGLATAFLLQAIDRGHRGYFVTFPELLQEVFQSLADRSEGKVLKRYLSYDCLVIDEVGYVEVEAAQVGQFFTLMHKRHKQKTTLITSNLGFAEWGSFLHNQHLTAADPPSVCARRSPDRELSHGQHERLHELARQAQRVTYGGIQRLSSTGRRGSFHSAGDRINSMGSEA